MTSAPLARDEARRLDTLRGLGVLDTSSTPALDGLVRCAMAATGCDISLLSLVDQERQWFLAKIGLDVCETPREQSFCAHAILGKGLFVVPDTWHDPRFADNPLVTGEPGIRFYAGAPLVVDGQAMGTLCVIDRQPRSLSERQIECLLDLTRAAEQVIVSIRQQRQLQALQQYQRGLFDQMGDGMLLLDGTFRVLDANPCALEMMGRSLEELPSIRLTDLLAADEHERLRQLSPKVLADSPVLEQWQAVRRDGRHFPAEVSVRALPGDRYVAIVRDITLRHAQEEQLRQLSAAVDQSSESIFITDLEANIIYVNAATIATSGYRRDELIGRNPRMLQSGRTPPATYLSLWSSLREGRPWKGLFFNRTKTGKEVVEFGVITPVRNPDGKVTQYLAVMEDVTKKRRLGEELDRHRHHLDELVEARTSDLERSRLAAESASEAKSAFLAAMSHEIRTPMNGVLGILEVLRQSSLTPHQSDLANTIRESSVALLGIIDDILDFSKAEAGALKLGAEPVDLLGLVESVCDALQPMAAGRGVQMQVFVDPALPRWIESDAMRLRQILNNLLGNAIKFSSGLDRVGRVALRCEPDGLGGLRIRVSDNGIGIAGHAHRSIFEPFAQGDRFTARRYGGTGLGLSICRRLVTLFEGDITVDSRVGQGALFTVTLPLNTLRDAQLPRDILVLDGVRCVVCLADANQARDWCVYLDAAGARASAWDDITAARQALTLDQDLPTVLVMDDTSVPAEPDSGAQPQGSPHRPVPLVRIERGQRRAPRLREPGQVSLDGDLVHREALVQSVLLAVGRPGVAAEAEGDSPQDDEQIGPDLLLARATGRVILVAEDNEINQTVIRHQLAALGHACEVVDNGLDALARWRRQSPARRYAMVLTDVQMPGLDGCELASAIRGEEGLAARVPIIALTANAMTEEAIRCVAAGMDDVVTKPIELDRLAKLLERWMPQDEGIAPAPTPLPLAPAQAAPGASPARPRVLLVDDEPLELQILARQLDVMGAPPVKACTSAQAALNWLAERDTTAMLLLLDLSMPGMDGVEFMRHLADRGFAGAVALVSGADVRVLETASKLAEAYQLNVLSHLHKPVPNDTLRALIDRWRGYVPVRASAQGLVYGADEIRHAIAHNELTLHYQPKVSMADGAFVGVEALVRWQHPRDGLCMPASFVPSAETHGLIDALTRTVLSQALRQLKHWADRGLRLRLAVNVSMDNLVHLDFTEFVVEEARRHGVRHTDLVLEVTESRLMRDARSAMDILTRLRLKRIGLSIDDFGTGHSSLAQLRDMPFDELKIDRGFVHGGREQATQRAILNASIGMAHQLGMQTVAEGVEDRADWDFARAAGCDVAQGFFIARPMPASAVTAWAAQWQERFEALVESV